METKVTGKQGREFLISTDAALLNVSAIKDFLNRSYWAKGISTAVVERSIAGSLCYGIYELAGNTGGRQVGFGRVITDFATFAYLSDIFIDEEFRGHGLSKHLVDCMMRHPRLQDLRRWCLITHDAQKLYNQFGFTTIEHPERHMEIVRLNPYGA